jgi:primosomal protein DnaI
MTLKEMRAIIEKDEETNTLKLIDADVIKVYQYIIERNANVLHDGYRPILKTTPYIEVVYEATDAQIRLERQLKIKDHLDLFDSETYMQDASMNDIHMHSDERKKTFELAKTFIDTYDGEIFKKGLYVYGMYGTGKTYILSAIAKELSYKGFGVIFAYMPDISRGIKQGMTEGTLEKRINLLKQTDILILDDLGAEYISSWFRDEVLMPIIQYRQSAGLPIFASSNYNMKQLTEVLAESSAQTDVIKAARLSKRLISMMDIIHLV